MILKFLLISTILFSGTASAKLLDKIMAVIDDKVVTLSQVRRVRQNATARKNISPQLFAKTKYTNKEIVDLFINKHLMREKLSEIGYVIGDDQVETQIKQTEKKIGVNRTQLLQFLTSNNITFDEYFELIRETIEFNIFSSKIVRPLISITEQEVKNSFYKKNINNKTLSFKYTLVDFSIEKRFIKGRMLKEFKNILSTFQNNGILPERFSKLQTNVLGDIKEDGLTNNLKKLLKRTDEGSFSKPLLLGSDYHIFFIKSKDLVESEIFTSAKNKIRGKLLQKQAQEISKAWYEREKNNHYIKFFF